MGIPRVPKDSAQLLHTHSQLLRKLQQSSQLADSIREKILEAVGSLVHRTALQLLKEIPVEEVNREKKGIRVTALRNSGYETMLDLHEASAAALAAVDGISDIGAREIKRITEEILSQAEAGTKIRLSADDRSPAASALIKALAQYQGMAESARSCSTILEKYADPVQTALRDLKRGTNVFTWLFLSREKKQKAQDGYILLRGLPYTVSAASLAETVFSAQFLSEQAAWHAFSQNPISFYNLLEQVSPGILGNDDGVYGLPQELAREIKDQEFFPQGLRCQLRRYQEWGVRYILHQGKVLLGDEMGLGKTVQAIAAMVSLRNQGATHFLVICPASVIENWCREIRKHSDLPAVKIHGDHREEALAEWVRNGGAAVTNYETTRIFRMLENDFQFTMAVVDEAHYIKNPDAQRTQNVREICTHAQRLLFMTGTALENRVEEMVTLLNLLQPEVARKADQMATLSSAPQFRELVSPVYYRRKRDDVLTELPELIETQEWCTLNPAEQQVYELAVLTYRYEDARRVSWNAPDLRYSSKAQRMLEIIEDAQEEGRKVIVFSFFLSTIEKVQSLLPGRTLQAINGSVPIERRQEIIDEFNAAPAGTVLPAQIQAGGTGLNIQCASVVILCEPQFKPSIENQAISRAYRMGQTRNVLVYRLLCEDTVDEKIMKLLAAKQLEFDAFADESAVGKESLQLDGQTFGTIMQEEAQRIREKNSPADLQADMPDPVSPGVIPEESSSEIQEVPE